MRITMMKTIRTQNNHRLLLLVWEEMINNEYASITAEQWNNTLKQCTILKACLKSKNFEDNGITINHLLALKLYTDFSRLSHELTKSFRSPHNKANGRPASFFHWVQSLREALETFGSIPNDNQMMIQSQVGGVLIGPWSVTSSQEVAVRFAQPNGMVLAFKPETDLKLTKYKMLDLSWISSFPQEQEYLLFDHAIEIQSTMALGGDRNQETRGMVGLLMKCLHSLYVKEIIDPKVPGILVSVGIQNRQCRSLYDITHRQASIIIAAIKI
eukprot:272897_1